mgnify:FL=1
MKKYNVIYADPPWTYKTYSKECETEFAKKHYPIMPVEGIQKLPVGLLAADDCALFMWITFPVLREAWDVMAHWGFAYKTVAFIWIKQNRVADSLFMGMGYWTRANAEICLLGTKGHPKSRQRMCRKLLFPT